MYKKTYTQKGLIHLSGTNIQFKSDVDFSKICQVRIIPLRKNNTATTLLSERDFRIEVVYDADLTQLKSNTAVKLHKSLTENISSKGKKHKYFKEEIESLEVKVNAEHFVGVDQNLDGIVTSNAYAYSLKPIKSVNHFWNKSVSRLKSEIAYIEAILSNSEKKQILTDYSTDCLKNTIHKLRNKIKKITRYRNNFIENYVHQLSNQFINQLSEKVQLIIYGKNVNFKKEINLGKITNQNFVQIPFNKIIEKISYKAAVKGIHFITVEESYTSKTSFLDKEELFSYKSNKPNKNYHFVGKRITRGSFETQKGYIIHADVNAACNIARKVIGEEIYDKVDLRTIMGSSLKKVKIKLS